MASILAVVIGYGYLGRFHVQKIVTLPEVKLVAIVEPFSKAQAEARDFLNTHDQSSTQVVADINDLDHDSFNTVLIITPTTTHADLVNWAIKHNKHIFCEKPLTATFSQSQTVLHNLAQVNTNLVTQVGHSERFHKCWDSKTEANIFSEANDILISNSAVVKFIRLAPFKGRGLDVGIETDLMIHDLDLAIMLFGLNKNYKLTDVSGRHNLPGQHFDHLVANYIAKHDQGPRTITFEAGRGYHKDIRKIQIWANEGVVMIDLLAREFIITREGKTFSCQYERSDHLLEEQKQFFNAILNDQSSPIDFETAQLALKELDSINSY